MAKSRLDGRNGEIWYRHAVRAQTQEQIAEELGISHQRVSQILAEVRESLPAEIDRQGLVRHSLEFLKAAQDKAMEIVELTPAPVFVGKDGSIARDENGNVVRDYSGRLKALEVAIKANETIAKRFGLDAPQKIETSGAVRYEIVGVDLEALS